jgi:hypothetical protein
MKGEIDVVGNEVHKIAESESEVFQSLHITTTILAPSERQ